MPITPKQKGFSVVEVLIALAILALLSTIVLSSFLNSRKAQSLSLDADAVAQLIRQARSQTISSRGSSQYGVRFASTTATLFTGSTYIPGTPTNSIFTVSAGNSISAISLSGGGSDIVFSRLSGEASRSGTITLSSVGGSKTITVYATGVVEVQ